MIRRLFTIFSAVSLFLLVPTAVFWVRSYWIADVAAAAFTHSAVREIESLQIESNRGVLTIWPLRMDYAAQSEFDAVLRRIPKSHFLRDKWLARRVVIGGPGFWHGLGFHFGRVYVTTPRGCQRSSSVSIPHWLLVMFLALVPLFWSISRWRRARHYGSGQCQVCGYDLSATPERCPECGSPVAPCPS
jgi:hypothetical protein